MQGVRVLLNDAILVLLPFRHMHYLTSDCQPTELCERYSCQKPLKISFSTLLK